VSNPHDALFRHVFSQPEHAASELRAVLPAALSARLDWSSLEPEPSSFVDEHLRGRQADLLFRIGCHGSSAFLYLLFEHQSTTDALMAFRMLRYMTRIWDAFLLAHPQAERLPAIIPVVLHHSDSGWSGGTEFVALLDVDPEILSLVAEYVPRFRFVLDDLSGADDRALSGRSLTAVAAAGLMLLARGRSGPRLMDDLRRWLDVLSDVAAAPNGVAALSAFLEYAFRVGEIPREDLRRLALQIGPAAEEAYMTVGVCFPSRRDPARRPAPARAPDRTRCRRGLYDCSSETYRGRLCPRPSGRRSQR
jgi:hypothetical protein